MGYSRRRTEGEGQRATTLELFYDLVFVFAITQVSHLLLEHLTWAGVGQSLLVLLVVWWSWNYTTWVTNELDTESISVRLLMISLMLLSLLMAVAIPQAFEGRGLLFAASYVAIQVGRHTFLTFVAWGRGTIERERAGRILIWFVAAGVLWIFGALAEGPARVALWLAALLLDYGAPLVVYWVPGLRRLAGSVWNVGTEHFAERFQLFIIIALGETIVITGATTADLDLDAARLAAFGTAFVTTAAMWWLYTNVVAVLQLRRQDRAAAAGALREPHLARPRRLHLPPRRHGRRHHRLRRRGRARDRAPHGGLADRGDSRRRGRPRSLPPRPRPLPPQDDR